MVDGRTPVPTERGVSHRGHTLWFEILTACYGEFINQWGILLEDTGGQRSTGWLAMLTWREVNRFNSPVRWCLVVEEREVFFGYGPMDQGTIKCPSSLHRRADYQ